MRVPVECKNCGIKWLRVTTSGAGIEMLDDLQYNCPACNSNWYGPVPDEVEVKPWVCWPLCD